MLQFLCLLFQLLFAFYSSGDVGRDTGNPKRITVLVGNYVEAGLYPAYPTVGMVDTELLVDWPLYCSILLGLQIFEQLVLVIGMDVPEPSRRVIVGLLRCNPVDCFHCRIHVLGFGVVSW